MHVKDKKYYVAFGSYHDRYRDPRSISRSLRIATFDRYLAGEQYALVYLSGDSEMNYVRIKVSDLGSEVKE